MISKIVRTFNRLATEHRLIRAFKYDRLSKAAGIGEERHPLFFLEDPIYIGEADYNQGTARAEVNFDIVLTPQALENVYKTTEPVHCQEIAQQIALNIIARMRELSLNYQKYDYDYEYPIEVLSYSFTTLRNWYDNKCSGIRCTCTLSVRNEINLCDTDAHFDKDKKLIENTIGPIDTSCAESCKENMTEQKLPTFDL